MSVNLGTAYGEIQIGTEGAQRSMASLVSSLKSVGTTLSLGVSTPLLGVASVALKSAGDFEQSMNQMQVVSGATQEQMAALQAQALQLGAETSFSAGEAAQGMLELGKAGLNAQQVGEAIGGVMALAAAGNLDLAQAAEIAANAVNAFNLPASETPMVADLLAAAANSSSVEVTDLAYSLQMCSAVLASYGQSLENTTTALAVLGNQGLKGSDAGTSLKQMFMSLAAPTAKAKKLMNELGIDVYDANGQMKAMPDILAEMQQAFFGMNEVTTTAGGRTAEQAQRMEYLSGIIKRTETQLANYKSGLAGVAESEQDKIVSQDRLNKQLQAARAEYAKLAGIQGTVTTSLQQMTQEERDAAMAVIFGSDGVRAANILLREGTEKFNEMYESVTQQGAAAEVAEARMKGFYGAIEYLKGSIDSFLINTVLPFLDSFSGVVRAVADAITSFGKLPAPVKKAALAFGAVLMAAGPLMLAISGIGAVLGALLSPVGLVTVAIAGLGAAWAAGLVDLDTNADKNIRTLGDAVKDVNDAFSATGGLIDGAVAALGKLTGADVQMKIEPAVAIDPTQQYIIPAKASVTSVGWKDFLGTGAEVAFTYDTDGKIVDVLWNEANFYGHYNADAGVLDVNFFNGLFSGHYGADAYVTNVLWGAYRGFYNSYATIIDVAWGAYRHLYDAQAEIAETSVLWGAWTYSYNAKANIEEKSVLWGAYAHTYSTFARVSSVLWGAYSHTYDALTKISETSVLWGAYTHTYDSRVNIVTVLWGLWTTTYDAQAKIAETSVLWGAWAHSYDAQAKIEQDSIMWGLFTHTYDASINASTFTILGRDPVAYVKGLFADFSLFGDSDGESAAASLSDTLRSSLVGQGKSFWPEFPTFTWPAYLAFTWPAYLAFTWPAYLAFTWPAYLAWVWPAFPSWRWPDIPTPGWLDTLVSAVQKVNPFGNNAGGTHNWEGGLSWVGERGPEIVAMPAGSRVYTAGQSNRMATPAGDIVINVASPIINGMQDVHQLAYEVGTLIKRQLGR